MQNLILQHKNLCTTVTSDQSTVHATLAKSYSTRPLAQFLVLEATPGQETAKVILSTLSR